MKYYQKYIAMVPPRKHI